MYTLFSLVFMHRFPRAQFILSCRSFSTISFYWERLFTSCLSPFNGRPRVADEDVEEQPGGVPLCVVPSMV